MDVWTSFSNVLSAFGLSSAAGLNAYIPLLAIGLLDRFGYLTLQSPFDLLSSTAGLIIVAVLAILDFVADKVPAVDHVVHVIGGFVSPVAGAIAFASQNNLISEIHPVLALATGFLMAGGFHATRAAIRPVATTTTAGVANPVLSFIEDLLSLLLSVLAFFAPLIAVGLLLLLIVLLVRSWRSIRRRAATLRRS